MKDIRQTPQYARYLKQLGWEVERIGGINYFIKKLPVVGAIIKIQRPNQLDIKTVRQLGKKYRTFRIIVEPKDTKHRSLITDHGFHLSKSPYLPSRTLCLNLTRSKEKLLAGLKKDCRAALRQTRKLGTKEMKNKKQIKKFRNAWKKAVGWKRYVPPLSHLVALKNSFEDNCLFLTTKYSNNSNRRSIMSSGAIFLVGDGIGYYWQAFTGAQGRKLNAQSKIVWEGILWAKKRGAKVFDFEGVYDPHFPNKSWLGFTHFKKSFGGDEISYPGAFVKNLLPFKLWI